MAAHDYGSIEDPHLIINQSVNYQKHAMKQTRAFLFALITLTVTAQAQKTEVLTLGTFHFDFPNRDVVQYASSEQIDVLQPAYQKEIERIVELLAQFKPTIIVIERDPAEQAKTDSSYSSYLQGTYTLDRNEEEQIGFRLAKKLGLKKLYCVNAWGSFTERVGRIAYGKDSVEAQKFYDYFKQNPDSAKQYRVKHVFKTKGILADLKQLNDPEHIRKDFGNYLIGLFSYESSPYDFTGVDFQTGRWFNRNLKIFRNIQRIEQGPSDKILVIYGAGHLNLLNYFFECSPDHRLVNTLKYLK